ncbi:MAG: alpha/beta fold hydrolase [Pseudomonadota bacterium]
MLSGAGGVAHCLLLIPKPERRSIPELFSKSAALAMRVYQIIFMAAMSGIFLFAEPVFAECESAAERGYSDDPYSGPDTDSIMALARQSGHSALCVVATQPPQNGVTREVVSFVADGLIQYALLLTPDGKRPAEGWPLLLFNHGFHPDPPAYGLSSSTGNRARPGDYYRGLPQAYARHGYLVVAPDFRGHADSRGASYSASNLATHWYVRDVIHAYKAARALPQVDPQRVFMTGHSMGAYITLRAALAVGDSLRAITLWSTSGDDPVTYLYSLDVQGASRDWQGATAAPQSERLRREFAELGITADQLTTFDHLGTFSVPVQLHHGRSDATTPFWNSLAIASRLRLADAPYRFFAYDTDAHLFRGENFESAIERDVQWFDELLARSPNQD